VNTVVSQALAVGLPVITTRHSGLPEQVTDGENGFLVDEGDYAALAGRILDLLEHPELIRAFSEQARKHVAQRYDAAVLAERQIDAYREVAFGVRTTRSASAPPEAATPAR
jgi:colanic acid/amylovoran biosynthesis glycosyltransferase